MPWHIKRDSLKELIRGKAGEIGTTAQGVGPVYADRTERVGLQIKHLFEADWENSVRTELEYQEKLTLAMYNHATGKKTFHQFYDFDTLRSELTKFKRFIAPMVGNVFPVIWNAVDNQKKILGEGAQAILLDLDLGSYPFVTSSHPGIVGFALGTGISPSHVGKIIGVTKAYQTRVGKGPMPTELLDSIGAHIRDQGKEFGTTTGRPRRCGWLDLPTLRYAIRTNGINSLALTKLDILDQLADIKVCTGYSYGGNVYTTLPTTDPEFMNQCHPVYHRLPGWLTDTSQIHSFNDLPAQAKKYIRFLELETLLPVEIISTGPQREATIFDPVSASKTPRT